MKKITYIFSSFVLLIIISTCAGYEPIFGSKNLINEATEIFGGDWKIK